MANVCDIQISSTQQTAPPKACSIGVEFGEIWRVVGPIIIIVIEYRMVDIEPFIIHASDIVPGF